MSKQSWRIRALPSVFVLGISMGSQLLGNTRLLAEKTGTFLGPKELNLDQN